MLVCRGLAESNLAASACPAVPAGRAGPHRCHPPPPGCSLQLPLSAHRLPYSAAPILILFTHARTEVRRVRDTSAQGSRSPPLPFVPARSSLSAQATVSGSRLLLIPTNTFLSTVTSLLILTFWYLVKFSSRTLNYASHLFPV